MRARICSLLAILTTLAALNFTGCHPSSGSQPTLRLATTTSTYDSGLLDVLLPLFQQQTGIEVKTIAVGSGQALELGRRGDVDVLLTHAPQAEEEFVRDGFGEERVRVFHNDLILVGPENSPLLSRLPVSIDQALQCIATEDLPFVSRGDDSGTHRQEMKLWKSLSIEPQFSNYLRAGSGMAQTLRIAAEKQAYTLTDRATYLSQQPNSGRRIWVEGEGALINPYSAIVVNPAKHAHVHADAARQFVKFLRAKHTQQTVADFGKAKYGEALFFPD